MTLEIRHPMRNSRRKGVALIIVLAILILVTALVVGFLIRTGSERTAAASYRATARTRQLADTVVNLVQAQINQATVATTGSGSTDAWASQPGAIRVFDGLGDQTIYKLYSSGTMVTGTYGNIAGDMPVTSSGASSWMSSPSLWVDLNAPAAFTISGTATLAYPILDPRNPGGGDFTSGTLAGFQVNPSQIGLTENPANPIAPMPAQWLYVLQDGTIVPPNLAQSTGTSVVLSATNVSASNPIVGRIAFWTDDDTCRLNINTAGDGTFWDTPHFTAADDWIYAFFSPAEYEYQRYPGHPATTSLLPVLSAVAPTVFLSNTGYSPTGTIVNLPYAENNTWATAPLYWPINNPYSTQAYNNLFGTTTNGIFTPGLLPQYAYGGSEEGTVPQSVVYSQNTPNYAIQTPCSLNNQRLFSSVGEMLLSPTDSSASPPARSYASVSGTTLLTRQELETAKFFLTAHSRSPELNLFGTPRISIWPFTIGTGVSPGSTSVSLNSSALMATSVRNTPTDRLLAFASTINANGTNSNGTAVYPYYFMRYSNVDPYSDLEIVRNGSNQNEQVLDYLDSLMSLPVPGFGQVSFYNKYSQTGVRQILTEILDYVRIIDTEDGVVIATNNNNLNYIFGQVASGEPGNLEIGLGDVVPILNTMPNWVATSGTLEGFGTFPYPTCVTIHFVGLGNGVLLNSASNAVGTATPVPSQQMSYFANDYDTAHITTTGSVANGMVAVQAFIYIQMVMPAAGRIFSGSPAIDIMMTGLNTLTLAASGSTAPLGFPSASNEYYSTNLGGGLGSYGDDAYIGDIPIFGETQGLWGGYNGRACSPTPVPGNQATTFAFYSGIIALPYTYGVTAGVTLGGGTNVLLRINDGTATGGTGNTIQTYNLNFLAASSKGGAIPFPVNPTGSPGTVASGTLPFTSGAGDFLSAARIIGTSVSSTAAPTDLTQNDRWNQGGNSYFDPYHDSAASLVMDNTKWGGDVRMLGIQNVPASAFVAHPGWGTQRLAYDLLYGVNFTPFVGGTTSGKLQGAATYATTGGAPCAPVVVSSNTGGASFVGGPVVNGLTFGDWDNGVGWSPDGPWINRPDEGGASTGGTNTYNNGVTNYYYLPYYTAGHGATNMGPGIFSPNREIPSPGMFGSLPTGIDPTGQNPKPWQTLLFRPGAVINHPGAGAPVTLPASASVPPLPPYTKIPDHLILDLFWMPAAEPFAISEPFSTAGKVNLNYQILPFGYVTTSGTTAYMRRDTGIRSAMQSLQIGAVPLSAAQTYKSEAQGSWWNGWNGIGFVGDPPSNPRNTARLPIDVNQTLQQFDSIFEEGGMFESASQICDAYLVPAGYTLAAFSGTTGAAGSWYGNDFAMVGDNVRERPYTDLYSRITTKSNTFTVYFTVQELKNAPNSPPNQWNEATGTVVGEYRGSKDMERYIQQSASMPNFLTYPAANPILTGTASLEPYYRWRIIEDNQFAP